MAASLILTEWGYLVHPALVFIPLLCLLLVALLSNICSRSAARSLAAAMPAVPCADERGTQLPPVERGGVQRDRVPPNQALRRMLGAHPEPRLGGHTRGQRSPANHRTALHPQGSGPAAGAPLLHTGFPADAQSITHTRPYSALQLRPPMCSMLASPDRPRSKPQSRCSFRPDGSASWLVWVPPLTRPFVHAPPSVLLCFG